MPLVIDRGVSIGGGITISNYTYVAPTAFATGGNVTTYLSYTIHTFTSTDTFSITSGATIDYLIVAGGGGAGSINGGGGGGGGGFLESTRYVISPGNYTITVGAGGAGGSLSSNGTNSSMIGGSVSIIAIGGGRGGVMDASSPLYNGGSGGSGGGGAGENSTPPGTKGSGTVGQGYDGVDGGFYSKTYGTGGGGGGAGGPGGTPNVRDPGGAKGSSITGTYANYAPGGTGYYEGNFADAPYAFGEGGSVDSYNGIAYSGANGIVIIRYPTNGNNLAWFNADVDISGLWGDIAFGVDQSGISYYPEMYQYFNNDGSITAYYASDNPSATLRNGIGAWYNGTPTGGNFEIQVVIDSIDSGSSVIFEGVTYTAAGSTPWYSLSSTRTLYTTSVSYVGTYLTVKIRQISNPSNMITTVSIPYSFFD